MEYDLRLDACASDWIGSMLEGYPKTTLRVLLLHMRSDVICADGGVGWV